MPRNRKSVRKSAAPLPLPLHPSDRELVDGIKAGSEAHFTHLYERYFQRIYGFVYLRMRNRADAEEAVQETFTAVYRSIDSYQGQSSLAAWIFGIAKNTVNNHFRRAKVQSLRVERAEVEDRGLS